MPSTNDRLEIILVQDGSRNVRCWHAPTGSIPDDPIPLSQDGQYAVPTTGLAFIPDGSVWIGTGKSGLFHYKYPVDKPGLDEVLADFLRYEHAYGRLPILYGLDAVGGLARVEDALPRTPLANVVRASDPTYFVHSTSRCAGDQIRRDGAIKSWAFLEQEGHPPQWHKLKSSVLNEPAEYAEYVNLGVPGNPWTEVVTASHRVGRFLGPDDIYEPGWRFYFDAHPLIEAGMITRAFGFKVHRLLPLRPFCIGQIGLNDVDAGQTGPWTPCRFTALADQVLATRLHSPDNGPCGPAR